MKKIILSNEESNNKKEDIKVSLNNEEYSLLMKVKENEEYNVIKEENKVTYLNFKENQDLIYEEQGNRLKESIIIKKRSKEYKYEFILEIASLRYEFNNKTNEIDLYNKNNKLVYRITPPYMEDKMKNRSNDCYYKVQENNNNVLNIELICDEEWINKEERVFPIIVDPTIEVVNNDIVTLSQYGDNSIKNKYLIDSSNRLNIKLNKEKIENLKNKYLYLMLRCSKNNIEGTINFYNDTKFDSKNIKINNGKIAINLLPIIANNIYEFSINFLNGKFFVLSFDQDNGLNSYLYVKNKIPSKSDRRRQLYKNYVLDDRNTINVNVSEPLYFNHVHYDATIKCNSLSVDINHIFDKTDFTECYLGNHVKTTLHQRLIKSETYNEILGCKDITYVDGNGIEHDLHEKWYYVNKNKQKVQVKREDIYLDIDQKLKINIDNEVYEVKLEVISDDEEYKLLSYVNLNNYASIYDNMEDYYAYIELSDGTKMDLILSEYDTIQYPKFKYKSKVIPYSKVKNIGEKYYHTETNNELTFSYENIAQKFNSEGSPFCFLYESEEGTIKVNIKYFPEFKNKNSDNLDKIYLSNDILNLISGIDSYDDVLNTFKTQYNKRKDNNELTGETNFKSDYYSYKRYIDTFYKKQKLIGKKDVIVQEELKKVQDIIVDKNNNFLGFDGYGRLILIEDKFENKINIEYGIDENEDKLVKVYSTQEEISFKYNKETSFLESMVDVKGRVISFKYDVYNNLSEIIYNNNDVVNISIDESDGYIYELTAPNGDRLTYIIDEDDYLTMYQYALDNNQYKLVNKESYSCEVGPDYTYVIDENKNGIYYYFDNLGNIVNISKDNKQKCFTYDLDKLIFEGEYNTKNELISAGNLSSSLTYNYNNLSTLKSCVLKIDPYASNSFSANFEIKVKYSDFTSKTIKINSYGNTDASIYIPIINVNNKLIIEMEIKSSIFEGQSFEYDFRLYELSEGSYYLYDLKNRLIKIENVNYEENYSDFNDFDLPRKVTRKNKFKLEAIKYNYTYNNKNLITSIEDSLSNVVEYDYDDLGNVISKRSYNKLDASLLKSEEYEYDEHGNSFKSNGLILNKDGNVTTQEVIYGANSNNIVKIKDYKYNIISYNYDFNNDKLLSMSMSSEGKNNFISYKYNYSLLTKINTNNLIVNYEYDYKKRFTKVIVNGKTYYSYVYNDNITYLNNKCNEVKTTYNDKLISDVILNKDDLVINEKINDGKQEFNRDYTYDKNNNLTNIKITSSLNDEEKNIKYEYDFNNNLTLFEIKNDDKTQVKKQLNYSNGKLISDKTYLDDLYEINNYTYNDLDNLIKVENKDNQNNIIFTASYNYDAIDRINHESIDYGTISICHEYSYLKQEQNTIDLICEDITKIAINKNNQKTYLIDVTNYTYDEVGNIIKIETDDNNIEYCYDSLSRIIKETNYKEEIIKTYKYDKNGNILNQKTYKLSYPNTPIKINEYIYNCEGNKDELISFNNLSFKYDNVGRPIIYKNEELIWNDINQLIEIPSKNTKYEYDGLNNRIKKIINGIETNYVYQNNQIIEMINEKYTIKFKYNLNKLIGFIYTSGSSKQEFIYLRNVQGDITSIYDEEGNEVASYNYDSYGNVEIIKNINNIATINPFRYRGYYYDEESNLYYLNSRYYDSETGRFISPDSIKYLNPNNINGLNLYAYCENNPVMYVDPSGHFVITATMIWTAICISAAIGACIGFGAAYIPDVIENVKVDGFQWSDLNTFEDNWQHYIGATLGGAIAGAGIGLCTVLGAGLGVALSTGTALTIGGTAISGGAALAMGVGGAFVTGGLGYTVRTGISNQEKFEWSDMFIEAGANAISGMLTFTGAMVGGIMGVKVPGVKSSLKNFALYHLGATYFGVYPIKIILAYIKKKLKERY